MAPQPTVAYLCRWDSNWQAAPVGVARAEYDLSLTLGTARGIVAPRRAPVSQNVRTTDRLGPLVAGAPCPAAIPGILAAPRHRRWPGVDDDVGAGRHCVCGGIWPAGHLRPLRHHRAAAGLCVARAQP